MKEGLPQDGASPFFDKLVFGKVCDLFKCVCV